VRSFADIDPSAREAVAQPAPGQLPGIPVMRFTIQTDPKTQERALVVRERGRPLVLDPLTNKGTAFTPEERDELELQGLLPPTVCSMRQQLDRVYENFKSKTTDLERFIYLTGLHDRNETLFFRLLYEHIDEMVPVVYTPTVGLACQKFSHIYRRARGLYISFDHRGRVESVLRNAPVPHPAVLVVTDGERILGLGDQGAGGMGIPIGKLCLYTLCAGIPPWATLPVMLDVGTENAGLLSDPFYLGLRRRRVRGEEYQAFIDEFVEAVKRVFPSAVLQWEDFLKGNAMHQLERFRDQLCSFNDDIQGTAAVALAGIYGGLRITNQPLREQRLLLAGAGAAAHGIADLFTTAICEEGLTPTQARAQVWTMDSHGLVTLDRPRLEGFKATYARPPEEPAAYDCVEKGHPTLAEVILNVRPTILIGTSATPHTFTEPVIQAMARGNARPLIFPLSHPTLSSECTAEEAIRWSEGRAIVATGSPFPPVTFGGRVHRVRQGNNVYVFPGVGLGASVGGVRCLTDAMFLQAAKTLAGRVTAQDLAEGAVYPELKRIRECSLAVACAVMQQAVVEGQIQDEGLEDIDRRVSEAMWFPDYLPVRYSS
jgi:malic enzyme